MATNHLRHWWYNIAEIGEFIEDLGNALLAIFILAAMCWFVGYGIYIAWKILS